MMWVRVGVGVAVGVGVDFSKSESESESRSVKFGRLRGTDYERARSEFLLIYEGCQKLAAQQRRNFMTNHGVSDATLLK